MLEHFSGANSQDINDIMSSSSVLEILMMQSGDLKPEPSDVITNEDHCNDFARMLNYGNNLSGLYNHHHIPRTISCPPNMALVESHSNGRESFKKRKAAADIDEKPRNPNVVAEERSAEEKKMKGCLEEDNKSKITQQKSNSKTTADSSNNSKKNSKENSKASSEAPKTDYIHVRARRGQATDSHSLAERVRREKISERMRYLQDLVPGCNKVTGKAGMLDEIINYVQSLQKQVEVYKYNTYIYVIVHIIYTFDFERGAAQFLSMKLAAMNTAPMEEFDVHNYLGKEVYTAANVPTIGASSSSANSHHQLQAVNELIMSEGMIPIPCPNIGVGILNNNPHDFATLRRTTSAPVSALTQDSFLDSPCLNMPWDDDLQSLYSMEFQQGRSAAFVSQPFTGFLDVISHVKQEMSYHPKLGDGYAYN